MPRYFFHIEGTEAPADDEGVLLDGPEKACSEVMLAAGDMLKDIDGQFWNGPGWRMQVTDEQGEAICTLSISGTHGKR